MGAAKAETAGSPTRGLGCSHSPSGTDRKRVDMHSVKRRCKRVGINLTLMSWRTISRARLFFFISLAALLASAPMPGQAAEARVAVATNFSGVAQLLAQQYRRQSGNDVELSNGSTGNLYAQITQGAPFDVFLSADVGTPQRLVQEGFAVRTSLFDYATGRLVLWSRQPDKLGNGEAILRNGTFKSLAIANPELAPYGAAARDVMRHLGRWNAVQPHLVIGENVGQAT